MGRPERSEGSHHSTIEIATSFHSSRRLSRIAALPATLRSRLRLIAMTFQVRLLRFARNDIFLSAI
jgi:hypothetical protein